MLFVRHSRSGHSLVATILGSHPEIIILDEFNLLYKFDSFFMDPSQTNDERKLRIFYDIHARSRPQAMFGSRSSICNSRSPYPTATTSKEAGKAIAKVNLRYEIFERAHVLKRTGLGSPDFNFSGVFFILVFISK